MIAEREERNKRAQPTFVSYGEALAMADAALTSLVPAEITPPISAHFVLAQFVLAHFVSAQFLAPFVLASKGLGLWQVSRSALTKNAEFSRRAGGRLGFAARL